VLASAAVRRLRVSGSLLVNDEMRESATMNRVADIETGRSPQLAIEMIPRRVSLVMSVSEP
jgi:hypothetical protein